MQRTKVFLLKNLITFKKERKKFYLPMAGFNDKIKQTIGLNRYDDIRKMLNIS